jgi:hypothetical protein
MPLRILVAAVAVAEPYLVAAVAELAALVEVMVKVLPVAVAMAVAVAAVVSAHPVLLAADQA